MSNQPTTNQEGWEKKTRKCSMCKETKSLSEFYKDKRYVDGLNRSCKKCHYNYCQSEEYKEKTRKRKSEYGQENREKIIRKSNEHYKNNKYKYQARSKLRLALLSGKISKQSCFVCGNDKTIGHHWDYSKALDVVWLCDSHHMMVHTSFPHFLDDLKSSELKKAREEELEIISKGIMEIYEKKYSHFTRDYREVDSFRDDILGRDGFINSLHPKKGSNE